MSRSDARWQLRRTVFLSGMLILLCLTGLGLLLLRWSGDSGAPPVARLYLPGDWPSSMLQSDVLLALERQPTATGQRDCYRALISGDADATQNENSIVCAGRPTRLTVGDAVLDVSIGARGAPRISLAGQRLRVDDWIGSLADPNAKPRPRFPLRAYGVPALAARVVECTDGAASDLSTSQEGPSLCLRVRDQLGRMAIARQGESTQSGGMTGPLQAAQTYRLYPDDELWIGLAIFRARWREPNEEGEAGAWTLTRVDRARAERPRSVQEPAQSGIAQNGATRDQDGDDLGAVGRGGDRRWLGRLWTQQTPDPAPRPQQRYTVHPLHQRYTPHNLSRQRVNFEGEDAIQQLIDGGWLCLERPAESTPRLAWRPFAAPGCDPQVAGDAGGQVSEAPQTRDERQLDERLRRLYYKTRHGSLAFLSAGLLTTTDANLADESYLRDPTVLPLAFDWRLSWRGDDQTPQPVPTALWGVRFGSTRQVHRQASGSALLLPDVLPRSSTARHLVQVWRESQLATTLALPRQGPALICLAEASEGDAWRGLRDFDTHLPLGAVALSPTESRGWWSADPSTPCGGCALSFTSGSGASSQEPSEETPEAPVQLESAAQEHGLQLSIEGEGCPELLTTDGARQLLADGDILRAPPWRLELVDRGAPWLARTDPADGTRHLAREFSDAGGLEPVLGGQSALAGVEAAVREWSLDGGGISPRQGTQRESFELTIDGDLQLTAAAIVDRLAREAVTIDQGTPVTAVILDAENGAVLAAVNWSAQSSDSGQRPAASAWDLGSGQVEAAANMAFLRRGAAGSTMKVAGGYALVNSGGLTPRPGEVAQGSVPSTNAIVETSDTGHRTGRGGKISLHRPGESRGRKAPSCSTGPHRLPASDAGYTECTFVRRFAESCNTFFLLSTLRHLDSEPADLRQLRSYDPTSTVVPAEGLRMLASSASGIGDTVTLLLPGDPERSRRPVARGGITSGVLLAQRLRHGLATDFGADASAAPRSFYGVLLAAGFQPQPRTFPAIGLAPAELTLSLDPALDIDQDAIAIPLEHRWFQTLAAQQSSAAPALLPGRDFAYPGVPSPGRLDPRTRPGAGPAAKEYYDGQLREARRRMGDRLEFQLSMMSIGQSSVQTSSLGLATLFAPAARRDGHAVAPCLFRANCGDFRRGRPVLSDDGADVLRAGLRRVVEVDAAGNRGTAAGALSRLQVGDFSERGWGGKTGTYEVERFIWPSDLITERDWRRLVARLCGVEGVATPRGARGSGGNAELSRRLAQLLDAPVGAALGSRTCENVSSPLHPAGIHAYQLYNRPDDSARLLDSTAQKLNELRQKKTYTYHAFVATALPAGGEQICTATNSTTPTESAAQGLVIAVLVDDETPANPSIAVQIGGKLADAAERWAPLHRNAVAGPAPDRAIDAPSASNSDD